MLKCQDIPPKIDCSNYNFPDFSSRNSCDLNQYYNVCKPGDLNPHKGAINFDNIGYAWIAIFQVSSFVFAIYRGWG